MTHRPTASTFAAPLRAAGRLATRSRAPGATTSSEGAHPPPEPVLDHFRRAFVGSLRELHRPSAALSFVSGSPTPALAVAHAVADTSYRVPTLVVPSAGVLTQAAEVEGAFAATGIAWSRGGKVTVSVGDTVAAATDPLPKGGSLLVFFAADAFEPALAGAISRDRHTVFGAGCPGAAVHMVDEGRVRSGKIAVMRFEGAASPIVETGSACRLVTDAMTVTGLDRGLVTSLDDQPALDVLTAKAGGGRHGGLILVAVHELSDPDRFLARPIRGIDPSHKAIAVAGDLNVGDRISFAVRDPASAREGLTEAARRAERHVLGSQATFGIYLSCAGRGRSLYGEADVDIKILKKRFPNIPIAGMHGAFEIVPTGIGASKMQLMSGVFALFRAPS